MRISMKFFIKFAYADKRHDRATAEAIIENMASYSTKTDHYKQFRDAMTAFEGQRLSEEEFLDLPNQVKQAKQIGYGRLCRNYLSLKEDNALTWQGRVESSLVLSGLQIVGACHLRAGDGNLKRVFLPEFLEETSAFG